jgi:hypothetical protein
MNAVRYGAACHEAGHAIVASSLGLRVGELWVDDDGYGGTAADEPGDLEELLTILLAGDVAQRLVGCQIVDLQSIGDHDRIRKALIERCVDEETDGPRLRNAARARARAILTPRIEKLKAIATELAASSAWKHPS